VFESSSVPPPPPAHYYYYYYYIIYLFQSCFFLLLDGLKILSFTPIPSYRYSDFGALTNGISCQTPLKHILDGCQNNCMSLYGNVR
jgi:hypothetical protein